MWMLTLITLLKNCFPVMIIASSINAIYLKVNNHVLERKVAWDGNIHWEKYVYFKIHNLQDMVPHAFGPDNMDSAGVAL